MDGRLARGAARRELLLDAAARVVSERGSAALTHRAVAAEAGVSLASVTYHFASVADLHRATFEHVGKHRVLANAARIDSPTARTLAPDVDRTGRHRGSSLRSNV